MAPSSGSPLVICDAGPLIHLDELQCLDVLQGFPSLLVPVSVADEVAQHRRIDFKTWRLSAVPDPEIDEVHAALARTYCLHKGETAALVLVRQTPQTALLLTDDAAARLACLHMGLEAHGTLGLLLRSVRRGLRLADEMVGIIASIPERSTLHIHQSLLDMAISEIKAFARQGNNQAGL